MLPKLHNSGRPRSGFLAVRADWLTLFSFLGSALLLFLDDKTKDRLATFTGTRKLMERDLFMPTEIWSERGANSVLTNPALPVL